MRGKLKKMILAQTLVVLAMSFGLLFSFSHKSLQLLSAEQLKSKSELTVEIAADKLKSELISLARESRRILGISKLKHSKNENREHYIQDQIDGDKRVLAFRTYRREKKSESWNPQLKVMRSDYRLFSLNKVDLDLFLRKHIPSFDQAEKSRIGVNNHSIEDSYAVIELTVPILRDGGRSPKELISLQVSKEWIQGLVATSKESQGYLLIDADGNQLFGSEEGSQENLAHLPIFQKAKESSEQAGFIASSQFPGGEKVYASFKKIGTSGLILVAQNSESEVLGRFSLFSGQFAVGVLICFAFAIVGQLLLWNRKKPVKPARSQIKSEPKKESREDEEAPSFSATEMATTAVATTEEPQVDVSTETAQAEEKGPAYSPRETAENEIAVEDIDKQLAEYLKNKRPEDSEEDAA